MTEQEFRTIMIAKMFDAEVTTLLSGFAADLNKSDFKEFYGTLIQEQDNIKALVQVAKSTHSNTTVSKAALENVASVSSLSSADITMQILKDKYSK